MPLPEVDLIITFRVTRKAHFSKHQTREQVRKAESQYARLIDTLTYAGLKAVGRRGEQLGHLMIFVTCPRSFVINLIKRERESDFLMGLPVTPIRTELEAHRVHLSPADRLRLVYSYVTSMPSDGGLGITPGTDEWDLIESVMTLHDKEFNDRWVRSWDPQEITSVQLDKIREQFGDAVAYYFAFLSSYTTALIFPTVIGLLCHVFSAPYSPTYSILLLLWSTTYTEWWRVHERILALRWGTTNSYLVEKRRAQYRKEGGAAGATGPVSESRIEGGNGWWKREVKILASVPIIMAFSMILFLLLTAIFVLEAFVAQLYTGPGQKLITLVPTLIFIALVPRFLALYQLLARLLTNWENHAHQSTHSTSLTHKIFIMSAIVAYGSLALSAFLYVPFGEKIMEVVALLVHAVADEGVSVFGVLSALAGAENEGGALVDGDEAIITMEDDDSLLAVGLKAAYKHHMPVSHQISPSPLAFSAGSPNSASSAKYDIGASAASFWDTDHKNVRRKLNPSRLQDQMFAYMVTGQIVNTFIEVGLPYVQRDVLPLVMNWIKGPPKEEKNGKYKGKGSEKGNPPPPVNNSPSNASRLKGMDYYKSPPSVMSSPDPSSPKPSPSKISTSGYTSSSSLTLSPTLKKRVIFEDEQEKGGLEEREFLEAVRDEAELPEYELFEDYSEMVVQFGYLVMWSGVWRLAPAMSLINNIFELKSDAFKITQHFRRPLAPIKVDTIGPWLDAMTFLTWAGTLTNAALIYLFWDPTGGAQQEATSTSTAPHGTYHQGQKSLVNRVHQQLYSQLSASSSSSSSATRDLLLTALVIALAASHGYLLLRTTVRHLVERIVWRGSAERIERKREEREVRERFLNSVTATTAVEAQDPIINNNNNNNNINTNTNSSGAHAYNTRLSMAGYGPVRHAKPYLPAVGIPSPAAVARNNSDDEDTTTVVGSSFSPRPASHRSLSGSSSSTALVNRHGQAPVGLTGLAMEVLRGQGQGDVFDADEDEAEGLEKSFWDYDEGREEIYRIVKEA